MAEPLDAAQIAEYQAKNMHDLLVTIEGAVYDSQDCCMCSTCSGYFAESSDINDDGRCDECAEDAEDTLRHINQESRGDLYV
jgi:hypothetical protein